MVMGPVARGTFPSSATILRIGTMLEKYIKYIGSCRRAVYIAIAYLEFIEPLLDLQTNVPSERGFRIH